MAMTVQKNRRASREEVECEASGLGLAGDEFLEQQCLCGNRPGLLAQIHRQRLVAQGQQARRLQPHDAMPARAGGSSASIRSLAFFFAWSAMPSARYVRPQQ